MVVSLLIVGFVFTIMGLLMPWMAEHGYKGGIGIKMCGTQSDPELWRRTHLLARNPFVYFGLVYLLGGLLFIFILLQDDIHKILLYSVIPLTIAAALALGYYLVKKAKTELESEKRQRAE